MFSTAPNPAPNQIIRGARTGDPIGHWDESTHILEDRMGRIRRDVPDMKTARRIMRDDWSWDVSLSIGI